MTNYFKPLLFLLTGALFTSGAFFQKIGSAVAEKHFTAYIEQNGKRADIKDNTVELSGGSFDIVFEFSEPMGVLVNASYKNKTLKSALQNKSLHKLPGFKETGMAEGLLNPDKEIFISNNAPSYWFYDTETENRFNKSLKTATGVTCTRTIENLYDVDAKANTKVNSADKPLYIVVVSYKPGDTVTDKIEIQRQMITIKWKK